MCRKIVVTSGKGGVGKTTVTAGLGMAIAEQGYKVLLIDADVGLNNLDVVMGVEDSIVYDMADVMEGRCRIKQALISDENVENLFILPSAHAYQSDDIGAKSFRLLIKKLEAGFDFIFIDCPAGIDSGFYRAVLPADEAIVVTTPHVSSIRDADKVLSLLCGYNLRSVNLIINRVRGDLVLSGEMMSPIEIARLLRFPPIGIVPEDDSVTIYSQLGRLYLSESGSRISFEMVADNIINGTKRLYDCTAKYRGVLGKIKMYFKKEA